jgi:hypothetical protein
VQTLAKLHIAIAQHSFCECIEQQLRDQSMNALERNIYSDVRGH